MIARILLIDIATIGFAIAAGLSLLCHGWAHRRWRPTVYFAIMSLTLVFVTLGNYWTQETPDPAVAASGLRVIDVSTALFGVLLPFLYCVLLGRRATWPEHLLAGVYGAFGLLALLRPMGLWLSIDAMELMDLGWFGRVYRPQGLQSAWRLPYQATGFIILLYCHRIAWSRRRASPSIAWPMAILPLLTLLGTIYHFGLFQNLWRGPVIWNYMGLLLYLGLGAMIYGYERNLVGNRDELLRSLRESKERLQLAISVGKVGTWRVIAENRQTTWDAGLSQLVGFEAVETTRNETNGFDSVHPEDRPAAMAEFLRAVHSRQDFISEFRLCRPDGETRWVRSHGRPFYDDSGKLLYLTGALVDIHDRKLLEATIRESEQRFREVLESLENVAVWAHKPDGTITFWNRASAILYAVPAAEALGKNLREVLPGRGTWAEERQFMEEAVRTALPLPPAEVAVIRNDGSRITVIANRTLHRCSHGALEFFCFDVDISVRKRSEEAVRQSEERLRHISEATFEGIGFTEQGRVLDVNHQLAAMLGYAPEEMVGREVWEFIAPEFRQEALEYLRSGSSEAYEHLALRKDGSIFSVVVRSRMSVFQGRPVHVTAVRDLTDRKRIEEALASEKQFAEALFESLPGTAYAFGEDGRFVRWNRNYDRLQGWFDEDMPAITVLDTIHVKDRGRIAEKIREIFLVGEGATQVDMVSRDGRVTPYYCTGRVMKSNGNRLIVGVGIDISDRVRAEEALRESERKYREIFNATSDAMLIHEQHGKIVDVNDQVCSLVGCDRPTAMQLTLEAICLKEPHYSVAETREHIRQAIEKGPQVIPWRLQRLDGTPFWCEVALRACEIAGQKRVIAAIRDVTQRKQAEEKLHGMEVQLTHVARLSTMGQLVAEVAHELSQPLYAILNYAKAVRNVLASEGPQDGESVCEWVEEIANTARLAAQIVKRLRAFARRTGAERSECKFNDIVEKSIALLDFEMRRAQVVLKTHLCPESPVVWADRVEILQVLVNLLQNAMEAMENVGLDRRQAIVRTVLVDQGVEFSVADQGIGLPPGDSLHIFDAFVTTKSGGLGMGLAISKTILEAHAGKLWATSNPEGGATFHGRLPLANEDSANAE